MNTPFPPLALTGGYKEELILDPPFLPAPGFGPLGEAAFPPATDGFGALVTVPWPLTSAPVTPPVLRETVAAALYQPRRPANRLTHWIERLHRRWRTLVAAGKPLLFALEIGPDATTAATVERIFQRLPEVGGFWLTPAPDLPLAAYSQSVAAAKGCGLPVLAALPLDATPAWYVALVTAGADMIIVGAPPMGEWPDGTGQFAPGRLYTPALLPIVCRALRRARTTIGEGIPLIAAGGIHRREDVEICREAGAAAYVLDGVLWRRPDFAAQFER